MKTGLQPRSDIGFFYIAFEEDGRERVITKGAQSKDLETEQIYPDEVECKFTDRSKAIQFCQVLYKNSSVYVYPLWMQ